MKSLLRSLIRKSGYDLVSYHPRFNKEARKRWLLSHLDADAFIDIGANVGQFASWLFSQHWTKPVHSFEPGRMAFESLLQSSEKQPLWTAVNCALGAEPGISQLNVSLNSFSSSLLPPTKSSIDANGGVATTSVEDVPVETLDGYLANAFDSEAKFAVKIDAQGFEREILAGADLSLSRIDLLIMEFSITEMYANQALLSDLLPQVLDAGFQPIIFETCDEHPRTMEIFQVDGWFIRRSVASKYRLV